MSASFTSELPNTTDPDDHGTHRSTDLTYRDTRYRNFTVAQGQHPSNSQVSPMPAPTHLGSPFHPPGVNTPSQR